MTTTISILVGIILGIWLITWGCRPNKKEVRVVRLDEFYNRYSQDKFKIEVKTKLFGWKLINLGKYQMEIHTPEVMGITFEIALKDGSRHLLINSQEEAELFCQHLLKYWKKGLHKSGDNVVTKTYEIE